eukprot:11759593-Alexandrium_andersonii.AAC.1
MRGAKAKMRTLQILQPMPARERPRKPGAERAQPGGETMKNPSHGVARAILRTPWFEQDVTTVLRLVPGASSDMEPAMRLPLPCLRRSCSVARTCL